jgi:hypothetical protein
VRLQARRSVKDSSPAFSHEKQPGGELPALLLPARRGCARVCSNCMQGGTPKGNLVKCEVCGLEYGLSHNCAGISPLVTPDKMAPAPGPRFAPLHYLEESFKILTWNDESVRRTAKDNNSLVYGRVILAVRTAAPFLLMLLRNWSLVRLPYTPEFGRSAFRPDVCTFFDLDAPANWIVARSGKSVIRGEGKLY